MDTPITKRPQIPLTPCEGSSQICAHGYHPESKTLAVQFHNGGTYHYSNVPADVAAAFAAAESKGKFLGSTIRGVFSHARVDEAE